METREASGRRIGSWLAVGLFATTIGFIGWILGARGGKRQYRHLVKAVEQILDQAQHSAHEAQDAAQGGAEDIAKSVKKRAARAGKKARRKAKKARR